MNIFKRFFHKCPTDRDIYLQAQGIEDQVLELLNREMQKNPASIVKILQWKDDLRTLRNIQLDFATTLEICEDFLS